MTVSSVLVVGGDPAGSAVARALAARGIEVCLVERSAVVPADQLRSPGVEVRTGVRLVGLVDVDAHVEAELSDGAVENYDAVLLFDPESRAVFATASPRVVEIAGEADPATVVERVIGG